MAFYSNLIRVARQSKEMIVDASDLQHIPGTPWGSMATPVIRSRRTGQDVQFKLWTSVNDREGDLMYQEFKANELPGWLLRVYND